MYHLGQRRGGYFDGVWRLVIRRLSQHTAYVWLMVMIFGAILMLGSKWC
jgi:hypothetical protein